MAQPQKFITLDNGRHKLRDIESVSETTGASDGSKLIKTDTNGKIHLSLLPIGVGADNLVVIAYEDLIAGNFVNLFSDEGVTSVRKADASVSGKEANGFTLTAVSTGANATIYFEGSNNQMSGLTIGSRCYLSAVSAGAVVTTPPAASGNVVQYLGVAVNATTIAFEATDGVILE